MVARSASAKYNKKVRDLLTNKRLRDKARAKLSELKKVPCAICGVQYNPWVMQFDHIDHATKKYDISKIPSLYLRWDVALKEISKCRVLCSNCHAEVTHRDRLKYGRKSEIIEIENQLELPVVDVQDKAVPPQRSTR